MRFCIFSPARGSAWIRKICGRFAVLRTVRTCALCMHGGRCCGRSVAVIMLSSLLSAQRWKPETTAQITCWMVSHTKSAGLGASLTGTPSHRYPKWKRFRFEIHWFQLISAYFNLFPGVLFEILCQLEWQRMVVDRTFLFSGPNPRARATTKWCHESTCSTSQREKTSKINELK